MQLKLVLLYMYNRKLWRPLPLAPTHTQHPRIRSHTHIHTSLIAGINSSLPRPTPSHPFLWRRGEGRRGPWTNEKPNSPRASIIFLQSLLRAGRTFFFQSSGLYRSFSSKPRLLYRHIFFPISGFNGHFSSKARTFI
jgi:hypothetical protein